MKPSVTLSKPSEPVCIYIGRNQNKSEPEWGKSWRLHIRSSSGPSTRIRSVLWLWPPAAEEASGPPAVKEETGQGPAGHITHHQHQRTCSTKVHTWTRASNNAVKSSTRWRQRTANNTWHWSELKLLKRFGVWEIRVTRTLRLDRPRWCPRVRREACGAGTSRRPAGEPWRAWWRAAESKPARSAATGGREEARSLTDTETRVRLWAERRTSQNMRTE